MIDDRFSGALRHAMMDSSARVYVVTSLERSLSRISLSQSCIRSVVSLLNFVLDNEYTTSKFVERVNKFRKEWARHLDRVYFRSYEDLRWECLRRTVFSKVSRSEIAGCPAVSLGATLDLGCGRGCLSSRLIQTAFASEVVGIDDADFTSEWNERVSSSTTGTRQAFERVRAAELGQWLKTKKPFDTILLSYVLHHSESHFVDMTMDALHHGLTSKGQVIVIEDSLVTSTSAAPDEDPLQYFSKWTQWAQESQRYALTPAFNAQAILDFVAVKLLAGFDDVVMPCTYRTSTDWHTVFDGCGFEVKQTINIGFPDDRDIDVPQAAFVLQRKRQ